MYTYVSPNFLTTATSFMAACLHDFQVPFHAVLPFKEIIDVVSLSDSGTVLAIVLK